MQRYAIIIVYAIILQSKYANIIVFIINYIKVYIKLDILSFCANLIVCYLCIIPLCTIFAQFILYHYNYMFMEISKVIKKYGLTIQDVADCMNVSRSCLAKTIGKNGNPTVSTLRNIADVLGCDVCELISEENTNHHDSTVCPHCGKPIKVHLSASEV